MGQDAVTALEDTLQGVPYAPLRVAQAVGPEAERFLVSRGSSAFRYREGTLYDEYAAPGFPTIAPRFPADQFRVRSFCTLLHPASGR